MQSPISPLAPSSSTISFFPWRPWSVPADWTALRRKICGLLNKVTPANAERVADHFGELAVALERSRDPIVVESCARMLVLRCVSDPCRADLLARLVQRATDETEGASLRWRSVDPYYLEDPTTSLSTVLRTTLVAELELALRVGRDEDACALSGFVGALLVLGVLSCDDVQDVIGVLYEGTSCDLARHCVALCRMLGRIVSSSEASHIINSLSLVARTEVVLEEDSISLKVRYMMMNTLDQCLYPKPKDAFCSDIHRNEAYTFDADPEHAPLSPLPFTASPEVHMDVHSVDTALLARNLTELEQLFLALSPGGQPRLFVSHLISSAMVSGDETDVSIVSSFLALPSVRQLSGTYSSVRAFQPHITLLEDTVLDVPSAYRTMATLLHAAELPQNVVEELASRIVARENAARDRLLDEVASLSACVGEDASDHVEVAADTSSGGEESASDYAYAY